MTAPPPKPRTLTELAAAAELGVEARALLAPDLAPRAFVQRLLEAGHHPDAIRLLAHALPRREAVWWAWVTAKRASGAEPAPPIRASLEATEKWIAQPTDANRRAAFEKAQAADIGTPAGSAGLAAFLSGDSLAPPGLQAVPPGEFDAAKAITGAVLLSAVIAEPEKAPEKMQASVQQGLDVVSKIKLWPE